MFDASLQKRALRGAGWNIAGSFAQQLIQFAFGVIIARLLSPTEFGLMGMLAIFVALTKSLVDGGFGSALVQKQDANEIDASSVFYVNMLISILLCALLCLLAPAIAAFYQRPILAPMMICLSTGLIFVALGRVHTALLTKALDFRTQSVIGITATTLSGICGVWMAYCGYGVWSLVAMSVLTELCRAGALWAIYRWRPRLTISFASIRSMWSYGAPLLCSSILDTVFTNAYSLVIGRLYSPRDVGLFTQARTLQSLPASNVTASVSTVAFPVFSEISYSPQLLRRAIQRSLTMLAFAVFPVVACVTASADSLVNVVLTSKWAACVPWLQLLCVTEALRPLHVINLTVIKACGHTRVFLRLEVIKVALTSISLLLTSSLGVSAMIIGQSLVSVFSLFLNGRYTSTAVGYKTFQQLQDVYPYAVIATLVGILTYCLVLLPIDNHLYLLILQLLTFAALYSGLCMAFRMREPLELVAMATSNVK
jgi:teichuronic acid exporter